MRTTPWHALEAQDVFSAVNSSESGLSSTEASLRLNTYGKNELPQSKGNPGWYLFLIQFKSPLMYIMMVATAVSFFIENLTEAGFIFVVMISNALVGFYQEHKANESLKALKGIVETRARVIRDNLEHEIAAEDIVPGDVIALRAGDRIPADARILDSRSLRINESSLTGEAKPVEKSSAMIAEKAEVADRSNMVFLGTIVEEGSADAIVVETGARTQYGDIVSLLKETPEEDTPLQKTVASLSKIIGVFITCVVGFIILEGYLSGHDFKTIFETALALFVSAIPEGLLPAITIILVIGMRKILQRKGLVRRLAATETLGGVTVICTDKTGTLTEGNMTAELILTADAVIPFAAYALENESVAADAAVKTSVLATDAYIENPGAKEVDLIIRGTFTEQALLKAATKHGLDIYAVNQSETLVDSLLFSSEKKYSAFLRKGKKTSEETLYVLGAPERVLEHVSSVLTQNGIYTIKSDIYASLIAKKDELVAQGYRVVACAHRDVKNRTTETKAEDLVENLVLSGFIAITDPIRPGVAEAFQKTHKAGIRTAIVTGDHALTAKAIAAKIGFIINTKDVLEGREIELLTNKELRQKVKHVRLYARVSPRHKLRIVNALQKNGEVVAMFGDGVNDAPALKTADIGVAVNTKVDAAREVADIVLLDGGFETIVAAIEQGRIIFNNIRRIFLYLITQDFSQFFVFILSIFLGLPLPLLAVQLLLVNLVESGLPDLALTTEQEKEGVMDEPPRNPKETILDKKSRSWMISIFAISGSIAMTFFAVTLALTGNIDKTRTMLMVFLCLESLFLVFSMRSFTKSIVRKDIFSNRILTWAVVISFGMVLAGVYLPPFQALLSSVPLSPAEWSIIILANICEIALIDIFKLRNFRKQAHALAI